MLCTLIYVLGLYITAYINNYKKVTVITLVPDKDTTPCMDTWDPSL